MFHEAHNYLFCIACFIYVYSSFINVLHIFEYDYFRQTPYHWAAKRGYNQILSILLDYGNHINQLDNEHRTPLWLAAKQNLYFTCEILLQKQANPFITNSEGKKPVDVATEQSVKKLILDHTEVKIFFFM